MCAGCFQTLPSSCPEHVPSDPWHAEQFSFLNLSVVETVDWLCRSDVTDRMAGYMLLLKWKMVHALTWNDLENMLYKRGQTQSKSQTLF